MRWYGKPLVVVCAALLFGCDKNGSADTDQAPGPQLDGGDDCEAQLIQRISNDHGHALIDPGDDENLYRIELGGNSGHSHFIELNDLFIEAVINGTSVTVETSTNSLHTHQITLGFTLPPGCGGFDDGFDDGFEDGPGIPPGATGFPPGEFTSGFPGDDDDDVTDGGVTGNGPGDNGNATGDNNGTTG